MVTELGIIVILTRVTRFYKQSLSVNVLEFFFLLSHHALVFFTKKLKLITHLESVALMDLENVPQIPAYLLLLTQVLFYLHSSRVQQIRHPLSIKIRNASVGRRPKRIKQTENHITCCLS